MTELLSSIEALRQGRRASLKAFGGSMYPFIRNGECITIEPAMASEIRYGDIVLYRDPDGKVLIHRIVNIKNKDGERHLMTKGDAAGTSDGFIDPKGVLGRVVEIKKDAFSFSMDSGIARPVNILYTKLLPLSRWLFICLWGLRRVWKNPKDSSLKSEKAPADFRDEHYRNSARNIIIYEEAKSVITKFNERCIPAVILKGVFLAGEVYKDISLRPMSDVDILVKKDDLPRANETLCIMGYLTPPFYDDVIGNRKTVSVNSIMYFPHDMSRPVIHIHWNIINSTWPLERLAALVDMNKIWSRAMPVRMDGVCALTLSPEHQIIYLAYHALHHSFDKPTMITDIIAVIRFYGSKIDWDYLREESERFGLEIAVYISLKYVSRISGLEFAGLRRLCPKRINAIESMVMSVTEKRNYTYALSYLTFLSTQRGLSGKLHFIFNTVFSSRIVMAHNFYLPASRIRPRHYLRRFINRTDFSLRNDASRKEHP